MAIEEFGNGKVLSDSTIYKFYSSEFKNQTRSDVAKKRVSTVNPEKEAQKIVSRLSNMQDSTAKKILSMVSAIVDGTSYGNRI